MNQLEGNTPGPMGLRRVFWALLLVLPLLGLGGGIGITLLFLNHSASPQAAVTPTTAPTLAASAAATPTQAVASSSATPTSFTFHDRIQGIAWSPGGSFYAVAAANGDIAVWEAPDSLRWQKNLGTKIWSIVWSPDSAGQQRLAVACDDGTVRLLDALSGQQLLLYRGHGRAHVLSVAWASDSILPPTIASGDSDGTILLWDPTIGKTRTTLRQAAPVRGLAFGGLYLISVGTQPGGTYIIWDAQMGQAAMQFTNDNHNTPYNNDNPRLVEGTLISVGWSSDNTYVTVGDTNGNVQALSDLNCSCWTYATGFQAHQQPINSIAWSPDNQTFATASDDGTVQTWKAGTWKHLKTFSDPSGAKITSVAWSPDGKSLLAGDSAGHLSTWQVT